MDTHQRAMWQSMLTAVERYRASETPLEKLVGDLRGLYVEADPHDPGLRSDFESVWSMIDAENELRTEAWAPAGSASDANLAKSLDDFATWVRSVLSNDRTSDQR